MAPLTPAPPKRQPRRQENPMKTPVPTAFVSRQIQGSQNRRAAAVLFTPCTPQTQNPRVRVLNQPSPTPQSIYPPIQRQPTVLSRSSSDSDIEADVREGLIRLNLEPRSSSGSQSPRAGRHSKQARALPKAKGGAKDVWTFFEKVDNKCNCILCQ